MTAPLVVTDLVTCFGETTIHDGLTLTLERGEVLGVVGGSGSGKSVLMRTILRLKAHAAGRICFFGDDIQTLSPQDWNLILRRIGVLFQGGALFSSLTVLENIEIPLKEALHLPPQQRKEVAMMKLLQSGLPSSAAHKRPSELSGGMRKRAGLARALALDPEVLFLDEPTAGLDPIGAHAFDQLIATLRTSLGLSVFMVTHDLDSLTYLCDRVAVLLDKRITCDTITGHRANPHPWMQSYFQGPRAAAFK